MIDRNVLKDLRPGIPSITDSDNYSAAEQFQNESLRPILKFQHDLLISIFQQYIRKRKNKFYELSSTQKLAYIDQSIRQDQKLKNLLIGTIIGHFTPEEYERYIALEKELRRRISDLLVQRLQGENFGKK
jgi:hypothetical protein